MSSGGQPEASPELCVPALVEQLGEQWRTLLKGFTVRQCRFVEEYLVDMNATAAAKRAGYSEKAARDIGYENLRHERIVDAITALMASRSKRTSVNRGWVLAQLVDAHDVGKSKPTAAHLAIRLKALELIGKHVDVRAFRAGVGMIGDEDDGRELWDLSRLNDEEFDTFERLLAKVTIIQPHTGGAGGAATSQGPGADSGGPGGDSGDLRTVAL